MDFQHEFEIQGFRVFIKEKLKNFKRKELEDLIDERLNCPICYEYLS